MHELGSAFVDSLERLEVAVKAAISPMLHQLCNHYLHTSSQSVHVYVYVQTESNLTDTMQGGMSGKAD